MRLALSAILVCLLLALISAPALAGSKYVDDFEFIKKTVAESYAALDSKKIDWAGATARMKPRFAACESDLEHVQNVRLLLAVLRDSHSGVTRADVDWDQLPGKWDGLYGAGLWVGWDRGYWVVKGMMEGLAVAQTIPLGSAIHSLEGEPMWLAMERERRRITTSMGTSSDHSLFGSMNNRLLPFGEKRQISAGFITPEGKLRRANLSRWGPGGKAFYPSEVTLPEGVAWQKGAVSKMLETPWCERLGYVSITGSMDGATVSAFHAAFDELKGMEACLLDCRGMGGGGDGSAWEMAGRFYPAGVNNGLHGRIEASGTWQFDGPVVMLQDEIEVSSAETFTWALSETGRSISVGRPTGGWGIIPNTFDCPSGLVSFRLGVNARPTPIKRVQTEGVGWPPDVIVPYGPVVRASLDPVREIGMQVLQVMHSGVKADVARKLFGDLMGGDVEGFKKVAKKLEVDGWRYSALAKVVEDDLKGRILAEISLLTEDPALPPDVLGATARLEEIAPRAKAAGLKGPLAKLEKTIKGLKKELAAQEALLALLDAEFHADPDAVKKFLSRHGKTRTGKFAKRHLFTD